MRISPIGFNYHSMNNRQASKPSFAAEIRYKDKEKFDKVVHEAKCREEMDVLIKKIDEGYKHRDDLVFELDIYTDSDHNTIETLNGPLCWSTNSKNFTIDISKKELPGIDTCASVIDICEIRGPKFLTFLKDYKTKKLEEKVFREIDEQIRDEVDSGELEKRAKLYAELRAKNFKFTDL